MKSAIIYLEKFLIRKNSKQQNICETETKEMLIMKNTKIKRYLAVTFTLAWVLQIAASICAINISGQKGTMIFQASLTLCMFAPMLGTLAANGNFKGLGWVPDFKNGKLKTYFLAWLLPAVLTAAGAVIYFLIFPAHFDTTGAYMSEQTKALGIDMMEELAKKGIDYNGYIVISILSALYAAFINAIPALGEEAGWRGFLYPQLKERFGRAKGLLLGGIIWGVWHFPIIILAGYEYGTDYIGAPFLGPVVFLICATALGILEDFVYEKTGCIWVPSLFHGAINAAAALPLMFMVAGVTDHMILGPAPVGIISLIPTAAAAAVILARRSKK